MIYYFLKFNVANECLIRAMLHCCYADDNSRQGVISANGAPYIPKENQITQFKEETKTMVIVIRRF
jgi:hypothetical protein